MKYLLVYLNENNVSLYLANFHEKTSKIFEIKCIKNIVLKNNNNDINLLQNAFSELKIKNNLKTILILPIGFESLKNEIGIQQLNNKNKKIFEAVCQNIVNNNVNETNLTSYVYFAESATNLLVRFLDIKTNQKAITLLNFLQQRKQTLFGIYTLSDAISYLKKQPQQNSFFCIVNGNYFDEANQIIYEILIIKNHFLFVRKMNFMQLSRQEKDCLSWLKNDLKKMIDLLKLNQSYNDELPIIQIGLNKLLTSNLHSNNEYSDYKIQIPENILNSIHLISNYQKYNDNKTELLNDLFTNILILHTQKNRRNENYLPKNIYIKNKFWKYANINRFFALLILFFAIIISNFIVQDYLNFKISRIVNYDLQNIEIIHRLAENLRQVDDENSKKNIQNLVENE